MTDPEERYSAVTGFRKFIGVALLIWAWIWLVLGGLSSIANWVDADDFVKRMMGFIPMTFIWFASAKAVLGGARASSWWKVWQDTTGAPERDET